MIWFLFVSVHFVLSFSTVPGQCKVFSYALSVSGSEESRQFSLEEHDHRLETMNKNMCSEFAKLEAAVNRTNIRGQEGLWQDLKTMHYNMTLNLERVSEKIPERFECHTTKDHKEYIRLLNLSLTSMTAKTEERIQAVNENLQNININLFEEFQVMEEKLSSLINESVVAVLRELNQKIQTLNEALSTAIDGINEKLNATLDRVKDSNQSVEFQDRCRNTFTVCDCSDVEANGYIRNGVYRIYVVDKGQRYYANAYCDMTTTNGPWTIFQRRKDGSVDFYRDWNEYADGFGNPDGEFWLGNDFLHLLTSKRRYRLRIDLEDFEGGKRYAEYSTFNISSSADKYRLRIGNYSGNSGGDCLNHSNGYRFTTKDDDNDAFSMNCAVYNSGAWWYNDCAWSNLNGLYLRGRYSPDGIYDLKGIRWSHWRGNMYSLKTTEMKISSS